MMMRVAYTHRLSALVKQRRWRSGLDALSWHDTDGTGGTLPNAEIAMIRVTVGTE